MKLKRNILQIQMKQRTYPLKSELLPSPPFINDIIMCSTIHLSIILFLKGIKLLDNFFELYKVSKYYIIFKSDFQTLKAISKLLYVIS